MDDNSLLFSLNRRLSIFARYLSVRLIHGLAVLVLAGGSGAGWAALAVADGFRVAYTLQESLWVLGNDASASSLALPGRRGYGQSPLSPLKKTLLWGREFLEKAKNPYQDPTSLSVIFGDDDRKAYTPNLVGRRGRQISGQGAIECYGRKGDPDNLDRNVGGGRILSIYSRDVVLGLDDRNVRGGRIFSNGSALLVENSKYLPDSPNRNYFLFSAHSAYHGNLRAEYCIFTPVPLDVEFRIPGACIASGYESQEVQDIFAKLCRRGKCKERSPAEADALDRQDWAGFIIPTDMRRLVTGRASGTLSKIFVDPDLAKLFFEEGKQGMDRELMTSFWFPAMKSFNFKTAGMTWSICDKRGVMVWKKMRDPKTGKEKVVAETEKRRAWFSFYNSGKKVYGNAVLKHFCDTERGSSGGHVGSRVSRIVDKKSREYREEFRSVAIHAGVVDESYNVAVPITEEMLKTLRSQERECTKAWNFQRWKVKSR